MISFDALETERIATPTMWQDKAACRGVGHLYFAPIGERPQARARRESAARAVCHSYVVLADCQDYIASNTEYGFWAGMSEDERHVQGLPLPAYLTSYYNRDRAGDSK